MRKIKLTGTIINYYIHCKRQCYLHYHKLNLEDNSELVKVGKALHKEKQTEELAIESIKVDKITKDYLIEIKKSDADIEAAKYQLLYYLKILKKKGIDRKGKLEVIEKKKNQRKTHIYQLDSETLKELEIVLEKIENLLNEDIVPKVEKGSKCKKCAYYGYCYI